MNIQKVYQLRPLLNFFTGAYVRRVFLTKFISYTQMAEFEKDKHLEKLYIFIILGILHLYPFQYYPL